MSAEKEFVKKLVNNGNWLPFDEYMNYALYDAENGYYMKGNKKFGFLAKDGSDFITAPEISPLFAKAIAKQLVQALEICGVYKIYEFGAGSGAFASGLIKELNELNIKLEEYNIIDVSGNLKEKQKENISKLGDISRCAKWINEIPKEISGVVIGNEVLDAMPVKILEKQNNIWYEKGISFMENKITWQNIKTHLRPPIDINEYNYITEIHPQAEAFINTISHSMVDNKSIAFFIDYGFDENEYYHPQRNEGTLVCHYQHKVDSNPLENVGNKDITAHVNFTQIALCAQNAGLDIIGYTTQARFLLNCKIAQDMEKSDLQSRVSAMKLIAEHEMGELFKVLCFASPDLLKEKLMGFEIGNKIYKL